MLRAGLLTSEQLSAIFLNVEELLEHNIVLAEKLKDSVELAQVKTSLEKSILLLDTYMLKKFTLQLTFIYGFFNRTGIRR